MTSKERVLKALKRQEPDRVPIGEFAIDYPAIEQLLGRRTFYRGKFRETQALWEGRRDEVVESYKRDTLDFTEALGFDLVIVHLVPSKKDTFKPLKQIGEGTYEDENGVIYKVSCTTEGLLAVDRRTPPPEPKEEDFVFQEPERPDESAFEFIRFIRERLGKTHFIVARAADIGLPSVGWGEQAYLNYIEKPHLCRKAAEIMGRRAVATIKWYADEGVDALAPGADYSHNLGPFISPRLLREWVFPWIKAYCDEAHRLGLPVLKHACGNNWALMDMFCEAGYDAYQSIQGSASMDLRRLKELYGSRISLWGGVQVEHLVHGTKEECVEDARYALRYAAPGGGFIFGSSHSVPIGAKLDNYLAALQFVKEHGCYPIRKV